MRDSSSGPVTFYLIWIEIKFADLGRLWHRYVFQIRFALTTSRSDPPLARNIRVRCGIPVLGQLRFMWSGSELKLRIWTVSNIDTIFRCVLLTRIQIRSASDQKHLCQMKESNSGPVTFHVIWIGTKSADLGRLWYLQDFQMHFAWTKSDPIRF